MSDKADKGGAGDDVSTRGAVAPIRRRGCVGHCKRFWWVHLIILCVIVAVVVPVILLVAIPKIAQNKINESKLEILSITASATKANDYVMSIKSVLRADGSVHANVDSFSGKMYLEDWPPQRPFVDGLIFPAVTSDSEQEVNLEQHIQINDMEAFTVFNKWLLHNDTVRVSVEGDTFVHIRGISRAYPVHFKKTLLTTGLRQFEGTSVSNAHISIAPDARGNNFNGTVTVPNRSTLSFEIGNATFYNYLDGAEVGEVFIENMVLKPGNNTFPMRATVQQTPVLSAMAKRPACESGVLNFQLRGKNVVNNGERLAYFADALAAANQTVPINIGKALKDSLNITISCTS